jgi:transcriptional regulator with XRE-family HTH domain
MPDDKFDLARIGKEAVTEGRLFQLRTKLGLSRNAMADMLHTSFITYTSWEHQPRVRLWPSTATRIGAFYKAAVAAIEEHEAHGGEPLDQLLPFHIVATYCGVPQEQLLQWFRDGQFEAVDLGILGLWVHRDEMERSLKR